MEIPSHKKVEEFICHIWNVHSWYKHIPLAKGMRFIIFLNEKAGENYPLEHPRLKYSNDKIGYQKQFGNLDYIYTADNINFYRDGGFPPSKSEIDSIQKKSEFILYPYVHSEIYWSIHEDALDDIVNGLEHPHSACLIKLRNLELECESLSEAIPDEEYDYCLDVAEGGVAYDPNRNIGSKAHAYIRNKSLQTEIWLELQSKERQKVVSNVKKLIEMIRNA